MNHPLPVQFIVVPEVRRVIGQPPSKPCRKMVGLEFARHVLENFDLDIAQKGIYANKYISCEGGLDTLATFFDEDWLQCLRLNALVWSDRSWRPMTETEKQQKRMDTKARVKKYVARCSNHIKITILLILHYQAELSSLLPVHQASCRIYPRGVHGYASTSLL